MTKMQSLAWMNGQYRQGGPLSQSPKAASLRNQQHGTENQCMMAQTGVQPPQNAHVTHYYVAYSQRQPSDWQTTADHQAVSFQQTSGGNNYLQPAPINLQSGNPIVQVTYGRKQQFHQNAAQNLSTQSPPNMTQAYIVCPEQDISPNGNQSVVVQGEESIRTQNGMFVSDGMFQNSNGRSNKPVLPYAIAATSHQPREVASNGPMGPGVHQRPNAHENHYRENGSRHSFNPPCTTNSSSSLHVSRPLQISQQYLTHNNGGEASSSISSNSYNRQAETNLSLSNPNVSPSNPAADAHAQQDLLEQRQSIARIEDFLRMPTTTGSDGQLEVYTSSPYRHKQDVSMVTMRESNQNKQPVTSSEMYNSNVSQDTPQSLRHSLPKATHNDMSIQHSIDVQPQQSSLPNVFHVSAKRDIIGNVSQAVFITENNVGSSSQLEQLLQCNKPHRIENQSEENNCDRLEMLPVKANDSSIYSSLGHTRAVAVVQPLLHKSYQVACRQNSYITTSQLSEGNESLRYPEKQVISPETKKVGHPKVVLTQKPPNQMMSGAHEIRHSATSNDGAFISPSSSVRPRDSFQKQLHTVDSGSKLDIDTQVHQRVSATAQQSVIFEAPVSPNGDEDISEVSMDTKGVALSSVPTTAWKLDVLTKCIQDSEKTQVAFQISMNTMHKLFHMFWNGNIIQLKYAIRMGTYTTIMHNAQQFCRENLDTKSVILSQVRRGFKTQLKNYHVLKENEVYSELPYKSSWLNVNEQLDDIDKEFDFPPSLKDHLKGLKSDGELDTDDSETDDSIPAQTVKEVSNKMSSKELDLVDPSEEKQDSLDVTTSTPMASPSKTECADSSDPYPYSFKIQVLPPEDAKVIFEQVQSNLPESIDMDYTPERRLNISVEEELPMVIDPTLSNSNLEDKAFLPIEEVCCIERLKETILGSNTTSLSKCQCNVIQSHKDITEKTCVKEVIAVQEKDAFRSDGILHSTTERENSPLTAFLWPEIINVFSHTIDVPEDHDAPQDPKNISHISKDGSESSIICISDEEEQLASSNSEIPNQMPYYEYESRQAWVEWTASGQSSSSDKKETTISTNFTEIQFDPEVECVSDQLKVTGNMHLCTSIGSDNNIEELSSGESEVASQMTNLKENCGQTELSSTNVEDSSLETEEQRTVISATGGREKSWSRKLKRPHSHGRALQVLWKSKKCKSSQPILEGTSKPRKAFINGTDGEQSPSVAQTVELFLYGSTRQNKYVLRSSHEAASHSGLRPPKVLSVSLSPLTKKTIKTVRTWDYSVKQLYRRWKISLPPAKIGRRKKKAWKCTFASSSKLRIKKADTIGPVDTEELPVSSEMRISNGKTKPYRNLSWRRSLSKELSFDEVKRTALLKQPADQERTNAEDESEAVGPLQDNIILKFSVLPVSFTFGSNGRQETEEPGQETPDIVKGKDDSHNKSDNCSIDAWYSNAEQQFQPPPPHTSSLFHAFQKTYMDMMQHCVDK